MVLFIRKVNAAKIRKASLQERGPKNSFERRILKSLLRAKTHLEVIYGVRIQKMPAVVVSARMLFADRETSSAYLKELSAREQAPSLLASTEHYRSLDSELLAKITAVTFALTSSSWPAYHPELQAIRVPPTYLLPPSTLNNIEETIMHELIHHALWEQKSPVYSVKKQWLYPDTFNTPLDAANEGLATYLQYRKLPSNLKSRKEIAESIMNYPLMMVKNVGYALKTAISHPPLFLSSSAGILISAATWLKKLASITLRNTIWRKPERFVRALHTNPLSYPAFDKYSDGLEFVKKVAKEFIRPNATFNAICHTPPTTYEEVIMPEKYLERLRKIRPELFKKRYLP